MCVNNEIVLDLPDGIATHKQNRTVCIDSCIAEAIKHLWGKGYQTLGCCCGHGKDKPSVIIADGYGDVEILAIQLELPQIDERDWDILQWRLMNVNGIFKRSESILGTSRCVVTKWNIPDEKSGVGTTEIQLDNGRFVSMPHEQMLSFLHFSEEAFNVK